MNIGCSKTVNTNTKHAVARLKVAQNMAISCSPKHGQLVIFCDASIYTFIIISK